MNTSKSVSSAEGEKTLDKRSMIYLIQVLIIAKNKQARGSQLIARGFIIHPSYAVLCPISSRGCTLISKSIHSAISVISSELNSFR